MNKNNMNVIFDSEKGGLLVEEERWETWKPTQTQREYVRWMYNPENLYNCEECPENHGFSPWPETRKPCGQFRCWVAIHCKDVED